MIQQPSEAQLNFWENKLADDYGLTMDRGRCDKWLEYGHTVESLDYDGRRTYEQNNGESLEHGEWPISLC